MEGNSANAIVKCRDYFLDRNEILNSLQDLESRGL